MKSQLTEAILEAGIEYAGSCEIDNAKKIIQENPQTDKRAAELVYFLTTESCSKVNGKLISAVWDPWEKLPKILENIRNSDVYTIRRILPEERDLTFE